MKKSIFLIVPLFFILTGFTFSNQDSTIVLQKSFDLKLLKNYLEKDEANQLLPIVIVTNGKIPTDIKLDFEGHEVMIYKNKSEADLYEDQGFIDIKSFKIKKEVSTLKFNYLGKKVKIKLRKKEGEWVYQSFLIRGKGKYYKDIHLKY